MSCPPSSTKSITGFLQCSGPIFALSLFLMCFSSVLGVVELGIPMMHPPPYSLDMTVVLGIQALAKPYTLHLNASDDIS